MTKAQTQVLQALETRPNYWITEASDLADPCGMTARGVLMVLYKLSDQGFVYHDDLGWHVTSTMTTTNREETGMGVSERDWREAVRRVLEGASGGAVVPKVCLSEGEYGALFAAGVSPLYVGWYLATGRMRGGVERVLS